MLAASQKCSATFHRSHSSHHECSPTYGRPICGAGLPLGQAFRRHGLGGIPHALGLKVRCEGHWILPLCTECEATSASIKRARSAPLDNHLRLSGWPRSHTRPIRVDPRLAPDELSLLQSRTKFSLSVRILFLQFSRWCLMLISTLIIHKFQNIKFDSRETQHNP